jgi:hypothetical protein
MAVESDGNVGNGETKPLTCEELVRGEILGKNKASERYDAILWKIRAGYVTVLYGTLTLLGEKAFDHPWVAFVLIVGFSASAFRIDYTFLRSKFRVVTAQNRLADITWDIAVGKADIAAVADLPRLLHISGEDPSLDVGADRLLFSRANLGLLVLLYAAPPVLTCAFATLSSLIS